MERERERFLNGKSSQVDGPCQVKSKVEVLLERLEVPVLAEVGQAIVVGHEQRHSKGVPDCFGPCDQKERERGCKYRVVNIHVNFQEACGLDSGM